MNKCRICGSMAINTHLHGRLPDVDLDLCDVCYWRTKCIDAMIIIRKLQDLTEQALNVKNNKKGDKNE